MQKARERAVSAGVGICAFVTPMMWPTIPTPLGVVCLAIAFVLFAFAAVSWCREKWPTRSSRSPRLRPARRDSAVVPVSASARLDEPEAAAPTANDRAFRILHAKELLGKLPEVDRKLDFIEGRLNLERIKSVDPLSGYNYDDSWSQIPTSIADVANWIVKLELWPEEVSQQRLIEIEAEVKLDSIYLYRPEIIDVPEWRQKYNIYIKQITFLRKLIRDAKESYSEVARIKLPRG